MSSLEYSRTGHSQTLPCSLGHTARASCAGGHRCGCFQPAQRLCAGGHRGGHRCGCLPAEQRHDQPRQHHRVHDAHQRQHVHVRCRGRARCVRHAGQLLNKRPRMACSPHLVLEVLTLLELKRPSISHVNYLHARRLFYTMLHEYFCHELLKHKLNLLNSGMWQAPFDGVGVRRIAYAVA